MDEENLLQKGEGPSLKRYVAVLFRYRILIASIFLGGTFIGTACAILFIRPMTVYDGSKVIRVRSPWSELENLTGDSAIDPRADPFHVEAEMEQFVDQALLAHVVDRCGLAEQQRELYQEFCHSAQGRFRLWLNDTLSFLFGPDDPSEEAFREAAVQALAKSITVEPTTVNRRPTPVLVINYYNPDRAKVEQVINALLAVYQEQKQKDFAEGDFSRKQRALFEQRFARLKKDYDEGRGRLEEEYRKVHLPFDADFGFLVSLREQEVLQLESQIASTESRIQQLEAQIAQLEAQRTTIMEAGSLVLVPGRIEDSLELEGIMAQYRQYSERITQIEVQLSNPELPASRKRVLSQELEKLRGDAVVLQGKINELRRGEKIRPPEAIRLEWDLASQRAGLDELKRQAATLDQGRSARRAELQALQVSLAQIGVMREEFRQVRDRYEQELIRREEREVSDIARREVQHLEEVTKRVKIAEEPRALHRLSRSIVILGSFFGSLAAGCLLAIVLGVMLDTSINSASEAERTLGVPVLALVPEVRRGALS